MSGKICFKCAINPRRGIIKEENISQSCGDCKKGIEPVNCKECGQQLVFCTRMKYYHDTEDRDYKCWWFEQK